MDIDYWDILLLREKDLNLNKKGITYSRIGQWFKINQPCSKPLLVNESMKLTPETKNNNVKKAKGNDLYYSTPYFLSL